MDPNQVLTGWGRTRSSRANVCGPMDTCALQELVASRPARGVLARGAGRSYGDAAQNRDGHVVTPVTKPTVELDVAAGTVRASASAAFAEVLLYFEDDVDGLWNLEALAGDADRLIDRRHLRLAELHINGRSADANHFANVLFCHKSSKKLQLNLYSAAAPLTISMISLVIAA